ncbi:MAG: phenylalanine--tRNA ligase subunit beta [Rhodospirillaceae bacterium]|nr:phenylalanine--tRNA ligase subunit beta [Rhodospirillaceae bacterium]MBT6536076.1 phenylalanine--tRNA ligase subunit beta [Rhodospirillaceae bacterium]
MKFTLSWLKDHLETDASVNTIVETLIRIGLEVDTVDDPGAKLAAFRVAHVIAAERHPDADRLQVCTVDTGEEQVQVVCGAPNARAGMKGVFAPAGTYVPGIDVELKKTKIRGVESNGMLVSEREMGLSDEHDGIIELPDDAPLGAPFATVLGLDDPVIDIELTPNRPDCTGVRGIARDLAAAGLGTLKPFDSAATVEGSYDSPVAWAIADDDNACGYVVGRHFRGVTNRPSPQWVQDRLRAIGLRPISALVDVTNYVSIDLGRPLHVFDAGKLKSDTLTMRRARDGEDFMALVEREYTLDGEMTVIGDGDKAEAVAGVMGGLDTSCTEETTDVFLEVALFDPVSVATTGRKLAIDSDARYRFERGVDPESANWGAEVATRMILEFCGGETSGHVTAGAMPDWQHNIELRTNRVATLGGVDIPAARQAEILDGLGFETETNADVITAAVPPWRPDVHGEPDLVEEITRIHGFDEIAPVSLDRDTALPPAAITPAQLRTSRVRRSLAAQGLDEAVTWSFMGRAHVELFTDDPDTMDGLMLANPISSELDAMRPSILGNLLLAAGRNADRGFADLGLFELGPAYRDASPDGQLLVAAGVRHGNAHPAHWSGAARAADALDAKADALAALDAAGAPTTNLQVGRDAPAWYHPGRSGGLRLGKNVLAWFGEIHPGVLRKLDVRGPAIGFEVFLDALPDRKEKGAARPPLHLSALQPVRRDFAFMVDAGVEAGSVIRAARGAERDLISGVELFDVYDGKNIEDGKKSLAIQVTLQPVDATLTDEDIDKIAAKIVAAVEKATAGSLRG